MELQLQTRTYSLSLVKGSTIAEFIASNAEEMKNYRVVVTGKPSVIPAYLTSETSWVSDSELLVDISDDNSVESLNQIGFWNQFDHFYFYNYAYLIPEGVENLRLDFNVNNIKDTSDTNTKTNLAKLNKINPDFAIIQKPEGLLVITSTED